MPFGILHRNCSKSAQFYPRPLSVSYILQNSLPHLREIVHKLDQKFPVRRHYKNIRISIMFDKFFFATIGDVFQKVSLFKQSMISCIYYISHPSCHFSFRTSLIFRTDILLVAMVSASTLLLSYL